MSPPRRPRNEKPRITIRYLQRQIANLQQELLTSRCANDVLKKQTAAQDVELSEAADRERIFIEQIENAADQYGAVYAVNRKNLTRLAFLEGYYAKSTEALPHDPAETNRRSGAGNPGDLPNGAQAPEEEGLEATQGWPSAGTREEVRRGRPDDTAYSDR